MPCVVLNETILPTDIETYKETDIELTTRSYTQTCTVTQAPTKRQKQTQEQLEKIIVGFQILATNWINKYPWHAVRIKNAHAYLEERWRYLSCDEKCFRGLQYATEFEGIALNPNCFKSIQKSFCA